MDYHNEARAHLVDKKMMKLSLATNEMGEGEIRSMKGMVYAPIRFISQI